MRRRDAAGLGVLADGREHRRGRRADVRAEDDWDGGDERHETGRREGERKTDDRRARPDERREYGGDEKQDERLVGEPAENVAEGPVGGEWGCAVADQLHAEEEKAEPEDRLTDVAHRAAARDVQEPACEDEERGDLEKVERQEPAHDVLGRLHAIAAQQEQPITELCLERPERAPTLR